jgi:hypothetical protein
MFQIYLSYFYYTRNILIHPPEKKKDPATALFKAPANARESIQRAGHFREQGRFDRERERERERERACARAGYFREQERYEGCMV